jgi:hypothetical protein
MPILVVKGVDPDEWFAVEAEAQKWAKLSDGRADKRRGREGHPDHRMTRGEHPPAAPVIAAVKRLRNDPPADRLDLRPRPRCVQLIADRHRGLTKKRLDPFRSLK